MSKHETPHEALNKGTFLLASQVGINANDIRNLIREVLREQKGTLIHTSE